MGSGTDSRRPSWASERREAHASGLRPAVVLVSILALGAVSIPSASGFGAPTLVKDINPNAGDSGSTT